MKSIAFVSTRQTRRLIVAATILCFAGAIHRTSEKLVLNPNGGADTITANDLSGTGLSDVILGLGIGDGAADNITVNGIGEPCPARRQSLGAKRRSIAIRRGSVPTCYIVCPYTTLLTCHIVRKNPNPNREI